LNRPQEIFSKVLYKQVDFPKVTAQAESSFGAAARATGMPKTGF